MRVFYVAQFSRGYEHCVVSALKEHNVEVFEFLQDCPQELLLEKLRKNKPDFVLFSKPQPIQAQELLAYCQNQRILTVTWVWDLYWGYRPQRPHHFYADILLSTDGGHQKEFNAHGYNHSVLRQGIHKPEHVFCDRKPIHDVAFVGGSGHKYYTGRKRLVGWLRTTYRNRFKHYTNTRGLALNRELARVKVVVGDSYPSPRYWSNRVYEITGRGGFLLYPKTEGFDDEFTNGEHYIKYNRNDFKQLKQIIDRWIDDDDQRNVICQQGFDYCGANYTYTHRVAKLLEIVKANPK